MMVYVFCILCTFSVSALTNYRVGVARSSHRMNSMEKWSTSTALAASSKDQMESAPKLDFNEDLYKVLEVDPSVDSNMLKKAYHKIVFKYHPDNKVGEREKDLANRQMMVINAAYKVLKNSDERKKYDRKRLYQTQTSDKSKSDFSQKSGFVDSSRPYSRTERQPEENESVESIFDILGDLWKDVQSNSGANLMDDFMDFLDGKMDATGDSKAVFESWTVSQLDKHLELTSRTLAKLKDHLVDLKKTKLLEESLLNFSSNSAFESVERKQAAFEENLRRQENVKSLAARVSETESQVKKLSREVESINACKLKKGYNKNMKVTSGDTSEISVSRKDNSKKVDEELLRLKNKIERK